MNWLKQQVANVAGTQEPIYGPSAIRSVSQQAQSKPWTELQKEDLKWKAMTSTCVETQTFYLMADSGHIGMAQVIYSNVIGLHTTCQFNSKIHYPNHRDNLWCSDSLDQADFDADKLSFHADGCAVTLNAEGDTYTIKSVVNPETIVNLTVKRVAPGFQVGEDGTSYFGPDAAAPWGSMRHAFWPRCTAQGTFITKAGEVDFSGRALFVHALQGMKPHHAAAKWNFVDFQTPTFSAVMMEFTTPPSYGSTVVNVGGIASDGRIVCAGSDNVARHTKARPDVENEWPEPEEAQFTWKGKTADGEDVEAVLEGNLGSRLDRVDVMAKVPGFIKTIVGGTVGTKPYIYQYSPEKKLSLRVKVNGSEKVEEGQLFSEATFISS